VTRDHDPAASYVKGEILSYLSNVPNAADTVEGIADWWIYRQRLRWARDTVQVALDALVAEGRLHRIERADGQVLYAAHPPPSPP
jgi:hypothetical protein